MLAVKCSKWGSKEMWTYSLVFIHIHQSIVLATAGCNPVGGITHFVDHNQHIFNDMEQNKSEQSHIRTVCVSRKLVFQSHILILGSGVKCISCYGLWPQGGRGEEGREGGDKDKKHTDLSEEVTYNEVKKKKTGEMF